MSDRMWELATPPLTIVQMPRTFSSSVVSSPGIWPRRSLRNAPSPGVSGPVLAQQSMASVCAPQYPASPGTGGLGGGPAAQTPPPSSAEARRAAQEAPAINRDAVIASKLPYRTDD